MTEYVRLESASLETAIDNPGNRYDMPMSTLIASEQWLIEAPWDGMGIGDVQIYRNQAIGHNGQRLMSDRLDEAKRPVPMADRWVWWGAVPRGKVKAYRFTNSADLTPRTLGTDGERKAEPGQAAQAGQKPGAAPANAQRTG